MTEGQIKDIDDVAPLGEAGDRRDFTNKKDLQNCILQLTDFRGPFSSTNGPFHVFDAIVLETGEEVSFSGATVLDDQGQKCRDRKAFPVNARLVKKPGSPNAYWAFVSPEASE